MRKISGFTLIELVVVIVILGILSAVAIPRYIDLSKQARTASLEGLAGALRSAAAIVKGGWYANGKPASVTMDDGTSVTVCSSGTAGVACTSASYGLPVAIAGGINDAAGTPAQTTATPGYSYVVAYGAATAPTSTTATFTIANYSGANCNVVYTLPSGLVTLTTNGC